MAFISLQKINKHYRSAKTLHVLQDVTLNVNQGDYIAIMGASGSGKSTLLNILGLLDWADSGDYFFGDKLINNITREEAALYRNKKIGLVFQSFNLIPYKNAIENIALPLLYQNVPLKERLYIARDCLQQFGLLDWADHLPSELSGGQKQRVAIARAVITNPQLILADEPTGALDSKTAIEVMQLFEKLHQKEITIVLVTHDENIASWADSVIHIKDGRII